MNRHHTAPTVVDLAEHATHTVRDLNHLTRFHDAITEPADLNRLLAELAAMTSGLPQLLHQLNRWLSHEHDTQQLGADTHTNPDQYVHAAATELTHASHAAHHLATALDTAHEHLAHLTTATTNRQNTEQPNQGVSFHP